MEKEKGMKDIEPRRRREEAMRRQERELWY